jgi:hypothetical protein
MPARCDVETNRQLNGVLIRVVHFDDRGTIVNQTDVIYTPAIARDIARNLLAEADKVEALGGPSQELTALCVANPEADQRRIRGYS